ncbi:MAG: hypothetical protein WD967_00150 [Candidatus Levyibacteriota bacterium]
MAKAELAKASPDGRGLSGDPVPPTISLRDLFESTEPGVAKAAMFLANATPAPLSGNKIGFVSHYQMFDIDRIVAPIEEAVPGLHAVVTFSDGDLGRVHKSLSLAGRRISRMEGLRGGFDNTDTVIMTSREALVIKQSRSDDESNEKRLRDGLREASLLIINGVQFGLSEPNDSERRSQIKKLLDLFPNADVIGFTANREEPMEGRLKKEFGTKIHQIDLPKGKILSGDDLGERYFNYSVRGGSFSQSRKGTEDY